MTLKNGTDAIKKHLDDMPDKPGVYRMIDKDGVILYVGKAKNLPKRVSSYTRPERLEYRIQSMISQVNTVEITTTATESEALLLESNFIKKYRPKYNILLKDDKSFPYIMLTKDHDYPRITKHRGSRDIKGDYFGPYPSAGAVNKAIADLQKAFLVRPCSDSYFANRKRPCIEYQIKRCSAPCTNKISQDDYNELIIQLRNFLKGRSRQVQEELQQKMAEESQKMNYEKAAIYRDRIKALNHIQAKQNINVEALENADILGISSLAGEYCVYVMFFRSGQNLGGKAYYFSQTNNETSENEIIEVFLSQFYQDNITPDEIYSPVGSENYAEISDMLSDLAKSSVKIITPQKGEKKKLVELACKHAKSSVEQKIGSKLKQSQLLQKVGELFKLPSPPKRIEVYDNSHIMGRYETGAMIVVDEEGFNKKAYRRFNIKGAGADKGDDYAMMREVLTRRFARLKSECPEKQENIWPDLVLIDGGQGQLSIANEVFNELAIQDKIKYVCISKGPDRNAGREQFHITGQDPFTLPENDSVLYFLQNIRDEAHNYAIGTHRKKRSKSVSKSALDSINGIGAKRKKLLLNHFGSVEEIKNASLEDIARVKGIDIKIAKVIYEGLR